MALLSPSSSSIRHVVALSFPLSRVMPSMPGPPIAGLFCPAGGWGRSSVVGSVPRCHHPLWNTVIDVNMGNGASVVAAVDIVDNAETVIIRSAIVLTLTLLNGGSASLNRDPLRVVPVLVCEDMVFGRYDVLFAPQLIHVHMDVAAGRGVQLDAITLSLTTGHVQVWDADNESGVRQRNLRKFSGTLNTGLVGTSAVCACAVGICADEGAVIEDTLFGTSAGEVRSVVKIVRF